jgi:hypothetical protein
VRSAPLDPGGLVRNGAFEDSAKGEGQRNDYRARWRFELRKIAAAAIQARRTWFFGVHGSIHGRATRWELEVWSYI